MTEFEGGQKSFEHVLGQIRLQGIFETLGHKTLQEEPTICINDFGDVRDFQVDVMVFDKDMIPMFALEVDTYTYAIKGAKSVPNMRNRDKLIEQQHKVPVIRFDIDALKTGRKKTKYYMTDQEIVNFVHKKYKEYLVKIAIPVKSVVLDT